MVQLYQCRWLLTGIKISSQWHFFPLVPFLWLSWPKTDWRLMVESLEIFFFSGFCFNLSEILFIIDGNDSQESEDGSIEEIIYYFLSPTQHVPDQITFFESCLHWIDKNSLKNPKNPNLSRDIHRGINHESKRICTRNKSAYIYQWFDSYTLASFHRANQLEDWKLCSSMMELERLEGLELSMEERNCMNIVSNDFLWGEDWYIPKNPIELKRSSQ